MNDRGTRRRRVALLLKLMIAIAGGLGVVLLRRNPGPPGDSVSTPGAPPAAGEVFAPAATGAPSAGTPSASTSPSADPELSDPAVAARQASVLEELLARRNDNDPRWDTELSELDPGTRARIRERFARTPPEARNVRGQLAFLIARAPRGVLDLEFLGQVLREPPCLSLSDCAKAPARVDPHHSDVDEKTLAYPQLVVLHHVPGYLRADDPALRERGRALLAEAMRSPIPAVARRAERIAAELGGP